MQVTDALIDSYIDSVHWFMCLFHEPTLRAELKPIQKTGLAYPNQRPLLALVFVLLLHGARLIKPKTAAERCPGVDIPTLYSHLLETVEKQYLTSLEVMSNESIAFSYLVGIQYLQTRRTKLAFVVIGTTLRAVQTMGYSNEANWGQAGTVDREVRRRLWWSMFMGDG